MDDNATNRCILEQYTSQWEMSSVSASGGPQALELLRTAYALGTPLMQRFLTCRCLTWMDLS